MELPRPRAKYAMYKNKCRRNRRSPCAQRVVLVSSEDLNDSQHFQRMVACAAAEMPCQDISTSSVETMIIHQSKSSRHGQDGCLSQWNYRSPHNVGALLHGPACIANALPSAPISHYLTSKVAFKGCLHHDSQDCI
eukprot:1762847-Amphidinium_carterae.1